MTRWCTASASARPARCWPRIARRMAEVGLQLHPDKTRIVYCQDGKRRGAHRAHVVHVPGLHVPAARCAGQEREHVRLVPARDQQGRPEEDQCRRCGPGACTAAPGTSFSELARWVNPIVRGWMQYYGAFYRSALYPLLTRINAYLMRWVRKKYRRFQGRREFQQAWQRVTTQYPRFFAHWVWTTAVPAVW